MSSGGSGSPILPPNALPVILPAGSEIIRIHKLGKGPIWFGPGAGQLPAYRFDASGGEFGVLYGADQLDGAFVETVLRKARRIVSRPFVEERQWSVLRCLRELTLLKLHDEGLLWHGVTGDICAGNDYTLPQSFSSQVYAAYPELDGIAYRARHDNGQICYALFERVASASLQIIETRQFAGNRATADRLIRKYNASWDPMTPLPPV